MAIFNLLPRVPTWNLASTRVGSHLEADSHLKVGLFFTSRPADEHRE